MTQDKFAVPLWTKLNKKRPVALVTGGASGIGFAVSRDLANDHEVIAVGRDVSKLEKLEGIAYLYPVRADLTDMDALMELAGKIERIDVLVHSAALSERNTVVEASSRVWRDTFAINVFTPAELTRLLLPKLRLQKGQIVFINSGAGQRAIGGRAVYSASKFALRALADALRQEEAPHGVRVATIFPGPTDTPMNRAERVDGASEIQAGKISDPKALADAVRLVINTEANSQVTDITVRPRQVQG